MQNAVDLENQVKIFFRGLVGHFTWKSNPTCIFYCGYILRCASYSLCEPVYWNSDQNFGMGMI